MARFWLLAPAMGSRSARFGAFEVLSRVGIGGMGEVFRARGPDGVEIALKLIRPEHAADPAFHQMLLQEGRVGLLLDHPRLVRTLDVGEVDGTLYLATELVEGASLEEIARDGPLEVDVAAWVGARVCEALSWAHRLHNQRGELLGLVHRDVSPANVLVSLDGEVKLADFGVVKARDVSISREHFIEGKAGYASPEQREGARVDARADLFSLGVLLHELITGQTPDSSPEIIEHELAAVIARATDVDPAARFESAEELAQAIRAFAATDEHARAELQRRVARARHGERPLDTVEQRLMDALGDAPSSDLVYAPDPGTRRLWLRRDDPLSQEITANAPPMAAAIPSETSPLDAASTSSWPISSPRIARWPLAAAAAIAAACALSLGLADGRPRADTPPEHATRAKPIAPKVAPAAPVAVAAPVAAATPVEPTQFAPMHVTSSARPRPARPGGFLTLDTEPWAVVYLDKRRLGTAPFLRVPVPAGRAQLTFDVQATGRRLKKTVSIPSGALARITLSLE